MEQAPRLLPLAKSVRIRRSSGPNTKKNESEKLRIQYTLLLFFEYLQGHAYCLEMY